MRVLGGTLLGVPIIRIIIYKGLYWGPSILGTTKWVMSSKQEKGRSPSAATYAKDSRILEVYAGNLFDRYQVTERGKES